MSYVEKVKGKKRVCETEVWSLVDRVKNLNAGIRRPSKLSLIDKRRTAALKLLPSGSPQIQWRGREGGEFSFFSLTPAYTWWTWSISDHTAVSQTCFFFSIWKKKWSGRPWYGHWQTWSKTWTPASGVHQNFYKRRMVALKLLPSGSPQIQWRRMEVGEFRCFFY